MRRLVVLALVALVSVALVNGIYAGYDQKGPNGDLKREGEPLSEAKKDPLDPQSKSEKQLVCDAIDCLAAAGTWPIAANQLAKMKEKKNICREMRAGEDSAMPGPKGNPLNGKINLQLSTICGDKSYLERVLFHEWYHTNYPRDGNTPIAEEHCTIRWKSFWRMKCKTTNTAHETKQMERILQWYPNFQDEIDNGATKTSPPPGVPDVNDEDYPARYSGVKKEVNDTAGDRKDVEIWISNSSVVSISWWPSEDPYAQATDSEIDAGTGTIREFYYYRTPWTSGHAGKGVILLDATDASGEFGQVKAIVDSNGDGVPNDLVEVVAPSAGLISPSSIAAIPLSSGGHRWFVFDDAASAIYNLVDSDADGVPDGLGPTFADSVTFPELATGRFFRALVDAPLSGVEAITVSNVARVYDAVLPADHWASELVDANGDGTADSSSGIHFFEDLLEFAPELVSPPCAGANFARAYGAKGHTIEARAQDQSGEFTIVLGSGIVGSAPYEVEFSLWRVLSANEQIVLHDVESDLQSEPITIGPANRPWVGAVDPQFGPRAGGTTVTLTGWDFLVTTQPVLIRPVDGFTIPAQVSSVTDTEIQFVTPALAEPATGSDLWLICIQDPRLTPDEQITFGFVYEP